MSTSQRERALIAQQLGRDPRGDVVVAARCAYGLPAVVRTRPKLETGEPFPTLYYLVCPVAVRAIGRVEATGRMREYQQMLDDDAALRARYVDAHERYLAQRDAIVTLEKRDSAGGMPGRVKCLHALYAQDLADSNPIGAMVRDEIEPLDCPGRCVEDLDGVLVRVSGHPGFGGKKRRR